MSNRIANAVIAAAVTALPAIDLATFNPRFEDVNPNPGATNAGGANGQQGESTGTGATATPAQVDPVEVLRTEFGRLRTEAMSLSDTVIAAGRSMTDVETTANAARFTRMRTIEGQINERNRFAALSLANDPTAPAGGSVQLAAPNPPGREQFQQAQQQQQGNPATPDIRVTDDRRFAAHVAAVNHFIRTGEMRHNQFVLTTTSGGVLVPTTIGTPIVIKRIVNPFRAALAARGLQVITTTGTENVVIPVFDDTANTADVIAQNNTSENNKDPSVSSLSLGALLYDSGTVWSSNTLLNAMSFDLLAYLQPMLDLRIDWAQLVAWTTAVTTTGTVGVTTASTSGVTYNELLNWQHSLPVVRRRTGVFVLSDGLHRALRGMVDSTGHPIYQESLRDEAPDKLLGWPVFISEQLATPAANAISGIAASAEGLHIRDAGGKRITRYERIPTHPDQFGIREFANGDFVFEAGAVRLLKHAAA